MSISFEEACLGFLQVARWAGVEQAGQQVVGVAQAFATIPQLAPAVANFVDFYTKTVQRHGALITRAGYTLPGYVPEIAVTAVSSDADLLRILRPFYDEFIASHIAQ